MKPIVLATDGSPSASEATKQAVELARILETRLVAVAVEHVAFPSYGYYGYAEIVTELTKIEKAHVEETLAQAQAIAAEAGVPCEVLHGTGQVSDVVCTAARMHDAQMIVIGAHGWGSIGRLCHGSVSMSVVHEAPCPVLVVRGGPEVGLDPEPVRAVEVAR
jgi:nucleotide-binding universal stress UspA family protein